MRGDHAFYIKYLLPPFALLVTYVVISQWYSAGWHEDDLLPVSGKVIRIGLGDYKERRAIRKKVDIDLDQEGRRFFVKNNSYLFPVMLREIQAGDRITIFHRTNLQAKWTLAEEPEILQIEKDGKLIYPLKVAQQPFRELRSYLIAPAILLWILYFYGRRKMRQTPPSPYRKFFKRK